MVSVALEGLFCGSVATPCASGDTFLGALRLALPQGPGISSAQWLRVLGGSEREHASKLDPAALPHGMRTRVSAPHRHIRGKRVAGTRPALVQGRDYLPGPRPRFLR